MNSLDVNKVLPNHLVIPSADNQLFKIGLCLTRTTNDVQREWISKPIFIAIITIIFTLRPMIRIVLSHEELKYFIIFGDFAYLMGTTFNLNIGMSLFGLLNLIYELIFYYNYKNDIKPTFLVVFQVLSGSLPASAIGLTNDKMVYKLTKRAKILFNICNGKLLNILNLLGPFMTTFAPYLVKCNLFEIIIYGIPHSLVTGLCGYYAFGADFWLLIHFYLICLYINCKIQTLNERIIELLKSKRSLNSVYISKTIHNLFSIYSEISKYDNIFWSKYFLAVWALSGAIAINCLSPLLFQSIDLFNRIFLMFPIIVVSLLFALNVSIASSVYYETNKSYKLLNSLFIKYSIDCKRIKNKNIYKRNIRIKNKVNIYNFYYH